MYECKQSGYPYQTGEMPQELKKWNWGAFSLNIWWGIGHRSYLTFLCLLPILNLIWPFVCGAKGNEWAWQNGNYIDIHHFNAVMEPWNRAGKIMFIFSVCFFCLYFLFILLFLLLSAFSATR